jgi:hypothetical protein
MVKRVMNIMIINIALFIYTPDASGNGWGLLIEMVLLGYLNLKKVNRKSPIVRYPRPFPRRAKSGFLL